MIRNCELLHYTWKNGTKLCFVEVNGNGIGVYVWWYVKQCTVKSTSSNSTGMDTR